MHQIINFHNSDISHKPKFMKIIYSIIILLFVPQILMCQNAEIVFEDHFENNDHGWRILQNQADAMQIKDGKFNWQHTNEIGNSVNTYFNLLNTENAYSCEAVFYSKKIGSEYGLMLAGTDQENAYFFTLKNLQYRIFKTVKGKLSLIKEYTTTLHARPEKNIFKVQKKGNDLTFYLNNHQLHSQQLEQFPGKSFGFCAWNNSSFAVDDFIIKGNKLKINLPPDFSYNSAPESLGGGVNSSNGELTPVITPDGKGMYFKRTYSSENKGGQSDYQDVYFSEFVGGKWNKAKNIGSPINNDGPNAVSAVSPDGNTLLLMNTYDNKGGAQAMGLSISQRLPSGWGIPKTLRIRNYYNKSTFNEYFLSNDNKILLLALERDDTYGTRDIYVSFLENDETWSTPKNLGPTVNTPGIELSPFIAADGVSLYFSSTGHPGYGKNDVFLSRRLDNTWTNWSQPINMGMPLNSKGIDAYYTIPASGDYAYFVSEEHSVGNSDIFRIKLPGAVKPQPVVLIYGKVLNSKTLEPISTGITYRDLFTDAESGIARSHPSDGSYKITLPYDKAYSFFAEKSGFYSVRDSIDIPLIKEYTEIERNIYLTPLELGAAIALKNVFFVRSEATLLSTSYPELNKLAQLLTENPGIEIELQGHTDNVGSAEKNVILSEQRVERVKKYLVEKGINEERVSGKGFGGSLPIADNSVEATRKLNRRVEFKITKF